MNGPLEFQTLAYQLRLLRDGARRELIEWLNWNDPHGCYTDDSSRSEGYAPLTIEQARALMTEQIGRDRSDFEVSVRTMEVYQTMNDLQKDYGIPDELMGYVNDGFLEVVTLKPSEKTAEFHVPALRRTDEQGRITTFDLTWIHPDFNSQFCHYYDESPGDLPNFYLVKDTSDLGDDPIDMADVDDLVCWLEEAKSHL